MNEWLIQIIWTGVGVAFFFAMITHLRIWSIAKDARRIADALEAATVQAPPRSNGTNEVRDFLE